MQKKKVLFIMESLGIGGAEKSLLTILDMIDKEKYDIDLYLFNHNGKFMNFIPENVNVLPLPRKYDLFSKNRKVAPYKFLLKGDIKSSRHSLLWLINVIISKVTKKKLYIGWNHINNLFDNLEKEYDTSIAFLERKTIYFNVDKVKAKNKIGFIHNDYSIYPYDDKMDRKYFKYYNKIVTVSDHCKEVLINIFPEYKEKFLVIKNMISKDLITNMSKVSIDGIKKDNNEVTLVSVGRLVKQKGFDNAIKICALLKKKSINVKWYIVGEGPEKTALENEIRNNSLENNFILVGADTNPYRWMNIADIYVQPSRFEGFGITVAEAKALNKPIVASNIPEFEELLGDGKGVLANDIDDFVLKIISILKDADLKNSLINTLKTDKYYLDDLAKLQDII